MEYITAIEFQKQSGMPRQYCYEWAKKGIIPTIKLKGKTMFSVQHLETVSSKKLQTKQYIAPNTSAYRSAYQHPEYMPFLDFFPESLYIYLKCDSIRKIVVSNILYLNREDVKRYDRGEFTK